MIANYGLERVEPLSNLIKFEFELKYDWHELLRIELMFVLNPMYVLSA